MKINQLHFQQALPISQRTAWTFLSDPNNLKVITPESMGFNILSGAAQAMYPGQIITYEVKPLAGISTRWVTEITHVKEGAYFVDEQRFGPYSFWHHKHFLRPIPGGVIMEDLIDYKLPFGFLGQWMHPIFIKKQLHKIFTHREKKLAELFGDLNGHKSQLTFKVI